MSTFEERSSNVLLTLPTAQFRVSVSALARAELTWSVNRARARRPVPRPHRFRHRPGADCGCRAHRLTFLRSRCRRKCAKDAVSAVKGKHREGVRTRAAAPPPPPADALGAHDYACTTNGAVRARRLGTGLGWKRLPIVGALIHSRPKFW